MSEERVNFGSKIGVILATAGSAVGLGNIWRFPYMAGENGGAAFIFIYILCVIVLGIPCMISEFIIGRHGKSLYPPCKRKHVEVGGLFRSAHWFFDYRLLRSRFRVVSQLYLRLHYGRIER